MSLLQQWGLGPDMLPHANESGLVPGRVVEEHKQFYKVVCAEGVILAKARGRLMADATSRVDLPAVGDFVLLRPAGSATDPATGVRLIERGSDGQVIAANVDVVFIVTSLNLDLNERRLERYLASIWESGSLPVILLTKLDLGREELAKAQARVERAAPGVPQVAVSAMTGEGLEQVLERLGPGKTGALVGSSGVGKSTLINALLGEEAQVIQSIREGDDKGRHTTTGRSMFLLPNDRGILIDTPGMREFMPIDEDGEGVAETYAEVEDLVLKCKFSNCTHDNEPGCAVRNALEMGVLDQGRFSGYKKQMKEQAFLARRTDKRAAAQERQKWKNIHKEQRRNYRARGR
jgi:ribosome biogenesis GTPase